VRQHICDRNGRPEKVVDRTGERPLVRLYPTCSLCGMPQVIDKGQRFIDRSAEGE
jgi:hypothetical protein